MAPARRSKPTFTKAHCNECGGTKNHDVLATVSTPISYTNDDGTGEPEKVPVAELKNEMLRCRGCDTVSYRESLLTRMPQYDVTYQYPPPVYRQSPNWTRQLPEGTSALMDEVYRALAADSRRLAMMGARALIDLVLQDKVGDRGAFEQRLARLESSGAVSEKERQVLAAALEAGHASSHRGYLPTVEDLNGVMDIVEHLLQTTYVLPKTAEEVAKRTPGRPPRPDKQPANVVSIDRAKER